MARGRVDEHQRIHAVGMAGRSEHRHRPARADAHQRRPLDARGVHHRDHVIGPLLQRGQCPDRHGIRKSATALVERQHARERLEAPQKPCQLGQLPAHLWCDIHSCTRTRSAAPEPNCWNATCAAPSHAYCVLGGCGTWSILRALRCPRKGRRMLAIALMVSALALPAPCTHAQLRMHVGRADGTAGTNYHPLIFTNAGGRACTLAAIPASRRSPVPTAARSALPRRATSSGVRPRAPARARRHRERALRAGRHGRLRPRALPSVHALGLRV